jgi:endonuclease/exonuclease/phosphatase family metal-dependent hydrolase
MRQRFSRALAVGFLTMGMALSYVGSASPLSAAAEPTCAAATDGVRWIRVSPTREHRALDRWCSGVGTPTRIESTRAAAEPITGPLAVVSWNTHVGAGDIDAFVADLRSGRLTGRPEQDFVLLLQEAYRAGDSVPARAAVSWAAAEQPAGAGRRVEVAAAADRLGLSAVYIPSMRNGRPGATTEDRGNAILSTRPLSDITAIELPLERQRRVAIAATITVGAHGGAARPVRIVCTHFTNMVMHHLWLLSESGRLRQARALAQALPADGPLIVGGDFNAWFGFHDAAYRQLASGMSRANPEDRRPTFGPLRLDHLLFRLPDGWHAQLRRADSKYGSDHYPLVAWIDVR